MPRKKAEKLVEEQEEFDVDEPSEVEELENNATDDDWTPAEEEKKPGRPQRASRNRKPIKLTDGKTTSDEEDEEEEEEEDPEEFRGTKRKRANVAVRGGGRGRGRGRGGGAAPASVKRARADENGKGRGKKKAAPAAAEGEAEEDEMEDVEDEEGMDDEEESVSDEEDSDDDSEAEDSEIPAEFKSGRFVLLKSDFDNKEENYPLWKIDGKSLLQKFDKFMHNNEELYKGTTIYAGWSKAIIDTYYPINVEYKTLENGESTVKFDPSQITPEMQKPKTAAPAASTEEGDEDNDDKAAAAEEEEKPKEADAEAEE